MMKPCNSIESKPTMAHVVQVYTSIVLILALFAQSVEVTRLVPIIKTVSENVFLLGEAPYYDGVNQFLYQVDILAGEVVRIDLRYRNVQKIYLGPRVSIIIPYGKQPGTFIVTRNNELLKLRWETGEILETLGVVSPELNGLEKFNDAKCDPKGRLFIGTFLNDKDGGIVPGGGSLYRLDGGQIFTKIATGFSISNGLAWSNDKKHTKLYFNDSEGRKIYVFDYEIETGSISNQKVLIDCDKSKDFFPGEYPDGMIMDKFGYIWVSMYAGGRIVKIDVEMAKVVGQIVLKPRVKIPSSLAWGVYEGEEGIFVTSASEGVPGADRTDDGKTVHVSFEGGKVYSFVK